MRRDGHVITEVVESTTKNRSAVTLDLELSRVSHNRHIAMAMRLASLIEGGNHFNCIGRDAADFLPISRSNVCDRLIIGVCGKKCST